MGRASYVEHPVLHSAQRVCSHRPWLQWDHPFGDALSALRRMLIAVLCVLAVPLLALLALAAIALSSLADPLHGALPQNPDNWA